MAKYVMGHRAARRSETLRSVILIGVMLIAASVMQTSFFGRLRLFGVVPDLTMIAVLTVAYFCGKEAGAVTGIAGGFLIDMMGGGSIVILPAVYLLLCYTVGHYARAVIPKRFAVYLIMLGAAVTVRCGVTLLLACVQQSSPSLLHLILHAVIPELLTNFALGCALYYPLRAYCALFRKSRRMA
jgi:rod shape-determining protein MreD